MILYLYNMNIIGSDDLLGYVDIDLTKLPFQSMFENTFLLHNSPYGENETITGTVRVKIAYDFAKHRVVDEYKQIPQVSSLFNIPFYPPTDQMNKQYEEQLKVRKKNLEPPYLMRIEGRTITNVDFDVTNLL